MISRRKFINLSIASFIIVSSKGIFAEGKKELRDLALDYSKLWAFNGHIGHYDFQIAKVNLGDLIILKIWNDTNWPHSMHLHGQHFWVNSKSLMDRINFF